MPPTRVIGMGHDQLVRVGTLLADDTRAHILTVLMDGRSYTGSELATSAGVARSTMSEHLSRLQEAGMVTVEAQGRHRYFALAGPEVARLLETVGAEPRQPPLVAARAPTSLTWVRSCYDHLAGVIAVRIYDQLVADDHLRIDDHQPQLTSSGFDTLAGIGLDTQELRSGRRPVSRACLDWTQRRHHLAGAAGAGLLTVLLHRGWAVRGPQPRSLRITRQGKAKLAEHLGIETSS